jgi:hypothetical protein
MTPSRVLRIDAGLDSAIAVLLLVTAFVPAAGAWARPAWLGAPVLLVAAAVLMAMAAGLLVLARQPSAAALRALGYGNGISGLALAGWAEVSDSFGGALRTALIVAAIGLAIVGVTQLRAARAASSEGASSLD